MISPVTVHLRTHPHNTAREETDKIHYPRAWRGACLTGDVEVLLQNGQMAIVHGTKGRPKVRLDTLVRGLFGPDALIFPSPFDRDDSTHSSIPASFPDDNYFAPLATALGKRFTTAGMMHNLQDYNHRDKNYSQANRKRGMLSVHKKKLPTSTRSILNLPFHRTKLSD